jgi:AraC family transcriptional regulator of arabinose operon
MAWLERRRLETACTLLLGTARSIQEIAAAVGFANPFHFSTRFRRLIGRPPSAWRRSPGPWQDQRRTSP